MSTTQDKPDSKRPVNDTLMVEDQPKGLHSGTQVAKETNQSPNDKVAENQAITKPPPSPKVENQQATKEDDPISATNYAPHQRTKSQAQPRRRLTQEANQPGNQPRAKGNNPISGSPAPFESEGWKAWNKKQKRHFDNFMNKAKDVQKKLTNLRSEITKIESSQDVQDKLIPLDESLQRVCDAFQNNFDALNSASQDQGTEGSLKFAISSKLSSLFTHASEMCEDIEKLLKLKPSKTPLQFQDNIETFTKLLQRWEPEEGLAAIRSEAVKRYFNETSDDVAGAIGQIGKLVTIYTAHEIPRVVNSQNRDKEIITNVTTVSTIISAVTAAIIAESLKEANSTNLFRAVNAFWFFSLALSIAAVINSMLDLFRRSYLNIHHEFRQVKVPYLIQSWIQISPRVFLAISVIAFQAGLCLLAFASQQPTSVSVITLVITALSFLGLIVTISWFAWHLIQVGVSRESSDRVDDAKKHNPGNDSLARTSSGTSWTQIKSSSKPQNERDTESGGQHGRRQCSHSILRFFRSHQRGEKRVQIDSEDQTVADPSPKDGETVISESAKYTRDPSPNGEETEKNPTGLSLDFSLIAKSTLQILQIRPQADPQRVLTRLEKARTFQLDHFSSTSRMYFSADSDFLVALNFFRGCSVYHNIKGDENGNSPTNIKSEDLSDWYSYDDFHWFSASYLIALEIDGYKRYPVLPESESDSESEPFTLKPEHYYEIYDETGKRRGKIEPPAYTRDVQFLHSRIGMVLCSDDNFSFSLHYLEQSKSVDSQRGQGSQDADCTDVWSSTSFKIEKPEPETNDQELELEFKCFCITRSDTHIICGTTLLSQPQRKGTWVSVIEIESGLRKFEIPLSQDLQRITFATHNELLIFEYEDASPELWKFDYENEDNMLELAQVYQLPRSFKINDGQLQFSGRNDNLVVYSRYLWQNSTTSGVYCVWERESGKILSIPQGPTKDIIHVVFSQSTSKNLFAAFVDKKGNVEVWTTPQEKNTNEGAISPS